MFSGILFCLCVCTPHAVLVDAIRGGVSLIPRNWTYRWLWADTWVLDNESMSSVEAANLSWHLSFCRKYSYSSRSSSCGSWRDGSVVEIRVWLPAPVRQFTTNYITPVSWGYIPGLHRYLYSRVHVWVHAHNFNILKIIRLAIVVNGWACQSLSC